MSNVTGIDNRDLPDGWQSVKLGAICEFTYGDALRSDRREEGTIPVYGSNGIVGYHNKSITTGPTIIIGRKGSVGEVHYSAVPCYPIDTAFYIEKTRLEADLEWLAYCLKQLRLGELNKATAIPGLNREDAYAIEIPLPPLDEQRRIAAILTQQMAAVDKARTAVEAQRATTEKLPVAYLREVFDSPDARSWSRKKLGEVCDIVAQQVDPKLPEYGQLPHVNGENIESGTLRLIFLNTASEDGMTSGKYLFQANDVLLSKLRPYLRKVFVPEFRGVCSADMFPIRVNRALLDPHFTAWLLLSDEFTKYADLQSRRSRMPKLNREQLFNFEAPIPPLEEQTKIVSQLNSKISRIDLASKVSREQKTMIEQFPAIILGRAFQGEL